MPDITGGLGTGAAGTPVPDRAVPLSGWFSRGRFSALTGISGAVAVGAISYHEQGDEIWAASASNAHIQAAIDLAEDGDVVMVPAGSVTWTGDVTIPATKGVKVIVDGTANVNLNSVGHVYLYTRNTNSPVRLSGFNFTNVPTGGLQINNYEIGATDWRVDHCNWTTGAAQSIRILGYTFGVFDNCAFNNLSMGMWIDMHLSSEAAEVGNPQGSYSWSQPVDWGGPSAVYFEDCTVHNDTLNIFFNCRGGARFVWRYSEWTGQTRFETHSGCTPGYRNDRWAEVYGINQNYSGGTVGPGIWFRSMNGMMFNNTFSSAVNSPVQFDFEFVCVRAAPCHWLWPVAGYLQEPPVEEAYWIYPAQDQVGVGLDTGWETSQALDEAKIWEWNNYRAGVRTSLAFTSCEFAQNLIQHDRDYFRQIDPFTGASGVGVGTLAARPSSGLTTGRFYWATDAGDQGVLYRSTGPTTWVEHYRPYTYPHPLRAL